MARKTIFNPTGADRAGRVTSLPSIFNLPTKKPAPKPVRGITIRKGGGALQNTVQTAPSTRRGGGYSGRRGGYSRFGPSIVQQRRKLQPYSSIAYNKPGEATRGFRFSGGRSSLTGETDQGTPASVKSAVAESLAGLVESYNQAYGQARQANEQRYQQLLQIANQDYQRSAGIREQMLDVAGQTTGQRAADIRSSGAEEEANVMQRLRQLGMSGTTVAPTLRAGVRRETEASLNRLADTMQQTKLGIMREQAGATRGTQLGIIERREDAYPDQAMLAGLVSSIGTGQGGDLIPSTMGALKKLRF